MTTPQPNDLEAAKAWAERTLRNGLLDRPEDDTHLRTLISNLRPAGVGEADPRYDVDVQYEVWCGPSMEAACDDLNEARRYEAQYQPCSLLKATTYRQPVGLPDATPAHPDAALMERVRTVLERLEPHLDAIVCYASTMAEYEPNRIASDTRRLLSDLKAEAGR